MPGSNASSAPRRPLSANSRAPIAIAPNPCGRPLGIASAANMRVNALADTGAILALLDRSDRWHRVCVETFSSLRLPLLTSEAVLTELFHLVGDDRHESESAWKFVRSGALELAAISHGELPAVYGLMSRYWDRPMDFAGATLVLSRQTRVPLHCVHRRPRRLRNLPNRWARTLSRPARKPALTW